MDPDTTTAAPAHRSRRRLTPALTGASLFLLLLVGLSFTETVYRGIERIVVQAELQSAARIALRLSDFLTKCSEELARLSTVEEIRNLNPGLSQEVLEFYREKSDAFESIALVDREGGAVSATGGAASPNPADGLDPARLDLAALQGTGLVVGAGSLSLLLVRKVSDASDHALGLLVARVRPRAVREAILSASLGMTERILLVDREGRIVSGQGPLPLPAADLGRLAYGTHLQPAGRGLVVTLLPVIGFDLRLLATREASEAFGFLRRVRFGIVLLVATFILVSFLVGLILPGRRRATDRDPAPPAPSPDAGDGFIADLLRAGNYAADLDGALQRCLDLVLERFRVERASVMLLNAATDELELAAVRVFDPLAGESRRAEFTKRVSLFAGEGVAGRVAKEGRGILAGEGGRDERFKAYAAGGEAEGAVRSIVVAPLRAGGETLGVLNIVNPRDGGALDAADLALAERAGEELARIVDEAALYQAAITDPATGLFTPAHFGRRLEREAVRMRRHGTPVGVVIARYDRLPDADERLSFPERRFRAAALARAARDAAGEGAVAARHRSEGEVILLLPRTGPEETLAVARRIVDAIRSTPFPPVEGEAAVTASAGCACETGHAFAAAELVKRADAALFSALGAGGNQALAHTPERGEAA